MLLIRDAQMQAFQQHRHTQLLHMLADYVRGRAPKLVAGWDDVRLVQELQTARQRAAVYGIGDPLALAEFFTTMHCHGLNFDSHPAIAAILRDSRIDADYRIYAVWERTSAATWAEVAELAGAEGAC